MKNTKLKIVSSCLLILVFSVTAVFMPYENKLSQISTAQAAIDNLPQPSELIEISDKISYPVLKGLRINPNDPFHLEFIVDTNGGGDISDAEMKKLVEYFLATLTIPEEDLWVNLSPYEKDKVAPENLSFTELGKNLLGQDYILKQLVASLTYPETELGKKYWDSIYKEVYKLKGTTNIPIDTFNKVWIVPKIAQVVEKGNTALITEASLKAMQEEDYLAFKKGIKGVNRRTGDKLTHQVASRVMQKMILPKIEQDINNGENFAQLRQAYHSFILAAWFKKKLQNSIFQYYIDQGKIEGVDLDDKKIKQKIYSLYVEAYQKGVYNYIKREYDLGNKKYLQRRYYSGGISGWSSSVVTSLPDSGQFAAAIRRQPGLRTKEVIIGNTASRKGKKGGASSAVAATAEDAFRNPARHIDRIHDRVWPDSTSADTWLELYTRVKGSLAMDGMQWSKRDLRVAERLSDESDAKAVLAALKETIKRLKVGAVEINSREQDHWVTAEAIISILLMNGLIEWRAGDPDIGGYLSRQQRALIELYSNLPRLSKQMLAGLLGKLDLSDSLEELWPRLKSPSDKQNLESIVASAIFQKQAEGAASSAITAQEALENPSRLKHEDDKTVFSHLNTFKDRSNWKNLLDAIMLGTKETSTASALSGRDSYFTKMLTGREYPTPEDRPSLANIQRFMSRQGNAYSHGSLDDATAEALIRALVIAGAREWHPSFPDIWMFRPKEEHDTLESIKEARLHGQDYRNILVADLRFSFREIDALVEELSRTDYYKSENIVAQALWRKEAKHAASSTAMAAAFLSPKEYNRDELSHIAYTRGHDSQNWDQFIGRVLGDREVNRSAVRDRFVSKRIARTDKGAIRAAILNASAEETSLVGVNGQAIVRILLINGLIEWRAGDPDIWRYLNTHEKGLLERLCSAKNSQSPRRALGLLRNLELEGNDWERWGRLRSKNDAEVKNSLASAIFQKQAEAAASSAATNTEADLKAEIDLTLMQIDTLTGEGKSNAELAEPKIRLQRLKLQLANLQREARRESENPKTSSAVGGVAFSSDLIKAEGSIHYNWSPDLISKFQNLEGLKVVAIIDGKSLKAMLEPK